jgi:hypothetical protein
VQQELVIQDIERMGHKVTKLWNIRQKVSGKPFLLFFLDIEPAANNSEIYRIEYLQNMRLQIEPPNKKKQYNIQQYNKCQAYFHTKEVLRTQTKLLQMWQIT